MDTAAEGAFPPGLLTLGGVVALLALASAACALVRRWKRREHHPLAFGSLCFAVRSRINRRPRTGERCSSLQAARKPIAPAPVALPRSQAATGDLEGVKALAGYRCCAAAPGGSAGRERLAYVLAYATAV